MDDPELRGHLLVVFNNLRNNADGWVPTSDMNVSGMEPVSAGLLRAICHDLAEVGLIQWKPSRGDEEGIVVGMAKITGVGADVVQGRRAPPISITIPGNVESPTNKAVAMAAVQADSSASALSFPALERALQLANEITEHPLSACGPSDDPDMQTAYVYGFREIVKRFIASVKRIGDRELTALVAGLDSSPEFITDAYDLKAELIGVIDCLQDEAPRLHSMPVRDDQSVGFDEIIHPLVRDVALHHYRAGDFREAVSTASQPSSTKFENARILISMASI